MGGGQLDMLCRDRTESSGLRRACPGEGSDRVSSGMPSLFQIVSLEYKVCT